jgi:hypothetical protein
MIKDPYVFDVLGLDEREHFSESDLGPGMVRYLVRSCKTGQTILFLLFDVAQPTINEHQMSFYECGDLTREATIRKFRLVQREGNRDVSGNIDYYKPRDTSQDGRTHLQESGVLIPVAARSMQHLLNHRIRQDGMLRL